MEPQVLCKISHKAEMCLFLLIFVQIHGAMIAFLAALQCKGENLLGEKQPKFTETSTALVKICTLDTLKLNGRDTHTYIHTHTHTHDRRLIKFKHTRAPTHTRTQTHTRTHTYTHAHKYTHTHTHTHTCTHTQTDTRTQFQPTNDLPLPYLTQTSAGPSSCYIRILSLFRMFNKCQINCL